MRPRTFEFSTFNFVYNSTHLMNNSLSLIQTNHSGFLLDIERKRWKRYPDVLVETNTKQNQLPYAILQML